MNIKSVKPIFIVLRETALGVTVTDASFFNEVEANDYANYHGGWVIESMIFEKERQ